MIASSLKATPQQQTTEMQRSRPAGTARCTFGEGFNAVIRARAREWLQRPVYEQSLRTHHPSPANRLLPMLKHLRLGRLGRHFLPPNRPLACARWSWQYPETSKFSLLCPFPYERIH